MRYLVPIGHLSRGTSLTTVDVTHPCDVDVGLSVLAGLAEVRCQRGRCCDRR